MIKLEEKLYTSSEVAQILGVSLRSVYRYIEENKLAPEVKTATGRHRFTKQNILDFLYPDGEPKTGAEARELDQITVRPRMKEVEMPTVASTEPEPEAFADFPVAAEPLSGGPRPASGRPQKVAEKIKEEPEEPIEPAEEIEPEVDWLAKFREAANKFKEESKQAEETVVEEETSIAFEPEKPWEEQVELFYYRSNLGGLKDIAQNIDKSSRNSGLEYAFTLNAGTSLHKPIKPFSVLHVYIRPEDKAFFERMLLLTPAVEQDSQLCLMVTDDPDVFGSKEEMHGLMVASKNRLKADAEKYGDKALRDDISSILK